MSIFMIGIRDLTLLIVDVAGHCYINGGLHVGVDLLFQVNIDLLHVRTASALFAFVPTLR